MRLFGLVAAGVLGLITCVPRAAAQDVDANAVANRTPAELSCLQAAEARLSETIQLLRQAYAQLRSSASSKVKQDAARTVTSLEQRLRELSADVAKCVHVSSKRGANGNVVYVEPPPDSAAAAVAKDTSAIAVVERDRALGPNLKVEVGEQVDGTGRVADQAVRDAVTRIAYPVSMCYARLLDRQALEKGELVLLFTVTPAGKIRHIQVERSTVGDAPFTRCVTRSARRSMRIDSPAVGGSATFSYELQLGPGQ